MNEETQSRYREICDKVTIQETKEGFFLSLVETLQDKVDITLFSKFVTDVERVKYVSMVLWDNIAAEPIFRGKKEEEAIAKRLEGNKHFEKKEYQKALLCYCQSIIQAPVGPELVNVYSNRSALFHKRGNYEKAIADAELAISYGAPEKTRHKLYERMAECHLQLGNIHKAKVILRLGKHFLEKFDPTNETYLKKFENLTLDIQKATSSGSNVNATHSTQKEDVKFGRNKKFPDCSDKVDVKYAAGVGRFTYAKKQIYVGEEILREKPYAAVLATDKLGTFCLHCFARLEAPVACETCANVAFCSPDCKKYADAYHKYECRILTLLIGSGMSLNCFLALRLVTQTSVEEFNQVLSSLESNPSIVPLDEKQRLENNYLSIYNLGALEEQRQPQDLLLRTIMTVFLLKCLRLVGYFNVNLFKNPRPTSQEFQIGGILLRNLQVVQFNAYEVCEFVMETESNYKTSVTKRLGLAIYRTASYFNHSCVPDVTRYFIGTTMVSTAIRTVGTSQPIYDNYGPQFTKHKRDERRLKLSGRYWFHCTCEACTNDWPMLSEMLEIETKSEEDQKAVKKLENYESLYFTNGMKAMDNGKPRQAIEFFVKFISECEKVLDNPQVSALRPYKMYVLAQQALQLCYCSLGSKYLLTTTTNKK